ncbi:CsbD family protein [Microbacterium sp. SD291]|uniref:CsbD family protein n=1 Tax=Microbacterium sp. SD291 TaxID=2782007 RepID=UPI001A96E7F1|nr:CsbD family protein [Microbacterium sp. SD291]MBO0981913.1 CsbD family protein [Microbacterium sp. SD291]
MGAEDRIRAAAEKVVGKAKEAIGHVGNDDKLVAEGKAEQTKGNLRGTGENIKDIFKK